MVLAVAPVIFAAVPSPAAAGSLVVCDRPDDGTTVVEENQVITVTPDSPGLPSGQAVEVPFLLDLYPAGASNKTSMTADLDWMVPFNDWDMQLRDSKGKLIDFSNNSQVSGGPPAEEVSATLKHCNLFTVEIVNVRGVPLDLLDPLELTVTTGSIS